MNVPETMTEVLDVSDEEGEKPINYKHKSAEFWVKRGREQIDTMTGDGGEYLRAEDLRELGDDSLPGQYLDVFGVRGGKYFWGYYGVKYMCRLTFVGFRFCRV
uniref:Uncharacterized protein n=1 Tax=Astyanax mexicanus TaxID=7994 RepID=A0A3B1KIG4_ASTMX